MSVTSLQQSWAGLQNVRRVVVVVSAAIALVGCAGDPGVDAVVDDLEQQLSSDVVPALAEHGLTDATWDAFHTAIRDVRTDDLHVALASGFGGGEGGGQPAVIESVVTIVGSEGGACIALSVSGDGSVRTVRVNGDPTANCDGAQIPDASL